MQVKKRQKGCGWFGVREIEDDVIGCAKAVTT